jgi:hypothetical protein
LSWGSGPGVGQEIWAKERNDQEEGDSEDGYEEDCGDAADEGGDAALSGEER